MKYFLFVLCFLFLPYGFAQNADDLIISEYGEGSSNNKYLEIYNGTGSAVDLTNFELWRVSNGGTWPEAQLPLSGSLANSSTYVVANNPTDTPGADVYSGSFVSWNGNDAVALVKNGVIIDVIGTDGADPGSGWDVAGTTNATEDHKLIRKEAICAPNSDWASSAGTNTVDSEWEVQAITSEIFTTGHVQDCDASSCGLMLSNPSFTCDSETTGPDNLTYTIDFTDGNNGDSYTISSNAGTVSGDDPNTVASGTITVTGIPENTDVTVTIENTTITCTETLDIEGRNCGSDIILVGMGDGRYIGQTPKFVELFVINDIPDLSDYTLELYANADPNDTNPDFTLSLDNIMASAIGGMRLFIINESSNSDSFENLFDCESSFNSSTHRYYNATISFDGLDDAIAIRDNSVNEIVDVYGNLTTGVVPSFSDGWAYRNNNTTPTPIFDENEWDIRTNVFPTDEVNNDNCDTGLYPFGDFLLPLDFLTISANNHGEQGVLIEWRTTSEDNLSHFEIQRMSTGAEFETIGEKIAEGDFFSVNNYSFLDASPQEGINQYRAMAVDNDGAKTYSDIVAVQVNSSEERVMYIANTQQVLLLGCEGKDVAIFDIMGQLIYTDEQISNNEAINASGWNSGVFIVRVGNQTHKIAKF